MLGLGLGITSQSAIGGRDRSALQALAMASSRPVDIVGLGDSNQIQGGFGWDHGIAKALATRYGLYATPVYIQEITGTSQSLQGFASSGTSGAANSATTGAPSDLEDLALPPGVGVSARYCYQASGDIGNSNGVFLSFVTPGIDVNANLRGHFCYATFDTGGGSFRPASRRGDSPFTTLVQGSVVSVTTGTRGRAVTTLDLSAATRDHPVSFHWKLPSGTASVGPMVEYWARVENRDRTAGISHTTMYHGSGQSLYDMAAYVIGQSDQALTNFFDAVRYIQVQRGHAPLVVMRINSGLNDRNETSQPSLGSNPSTDADSPEAYLDNLQAVINRVEGVYALNNWPLSGLYWLITPSHRISDPDDAELLTYRSIVRAWAQSRPRVSFVDFNDLMTYAEAISGSWYASSGADVNHLTQAGYETLATREIALVPSP